MEDGILDTLQSMALRADAKSIAMRLESAVSEQEKQLLEVALAGALERCTDSEHVEHILHVLDMAGTSPCIYTHANAALENAIRSGAAFPFITEISQRYDLGENVVISLVRYFHAEGSLESLADFLERRHIPEKVRLEIENLSADLIEEKYLRGDIPAVDKSQIKRICRNRWISEALRRKVSVILKHLEPESNDGFFQNPSGTFRKGFLQPVKRACPVLPVKAK